MITSSLVSTRLSLSINGPQWETWGTLRPWCPLVYPVPSVHSAFPCAAKDPSLCSGIGFLSLTCNTSSSGPQAHAPLLAGGLQSVLLGHWILLPQSNLVGLRWLCLYVPCQVQVWHYSLVQTCPCNAHTKVTLALVAMIAETEVFPVQKPKLPEFPIRKL